MISNTSFEELEKEIHDYILSSSHSEEKFNEIALKIFGFQMKNNLPYRNFVQKTSPQKIENWREIPPLSTEAFKERRFPITSFSIDSKTQKFITSGTTSENQGVHYMKNTKLYETSILQYWQKLELAEVENIFFLSPRIKDFPHSSLIYMFETLSKFFTEKNKSCFWISKSGERNQSFIFQKWIENKPLLLFGTALSLIHFLEKNPPPFPPESIIFQTGGYKGKEEEYSSSFLYEQISKKLKISHKSILNEYSMTEISSQFYTKGVKEMHLSPPWMKVQAIDPENGRKVSSGQIGHLIAYDLANLSSVIAVKTQDRVIYQDSQSFTFLEREKNANEKGCSLTLYDA